MIRFIFSFVLLFQSLAFAASDEYGHEIEPSPSVVDQLVLINSPLMISGGSYGFTVNWKVLICGNMPKKSWIDMMIESDSKWTDLVDDPAPDKNFKKKKKELRKLLAAKYAEDWKVKVQLWEAYTRRPYKEGTDSIFKRFNLKIGPFH